MGRTKELMLHPHIKIVMALICIVTSIAFQSTAAVYASKSDDRAILIVAKRYVDSHSAPRMKFKLKLTKTVSNWAMVEVIPLVEVEGASVLLEKVKDKWVAREFGTMFESWRTKAPKELFDFSD